MPICTYSNNNLCKLWSLWLESISAISFENCLVHLIPVPKRFDSFTFDICHANPKWKWFVLNRTRHCQNAKSLASQHTILVCSIKRQKANCNFTFFCKREILFATNSIISLWLRKNRSKWQQTSINRKTNQTWFYSHMLRYH